MAVSAADIQTRFSEFAAESTTRIEQFIADASLSVNPRVWREKTDLGIIYLTAHMLSLAPSAATIASGGPNAGIVKSEKVGDLSRTFAVGNPSANSSTAAELSATIYGQTFVRLRNELVRSPVVVNQSGSVI